MKGSLKMEERELFLLEQPASRSFGDGLVWSRQAWFLTKRRFGTWLLISLVMNLCFLGVGILAGFLGETVANIIGILANAVALVFYGGLMGAMASLAEEDDLEVGYLFTGFQYKFVDLLILFVLMILLLIPIGILVGGLTYALGKSSLIIWIILGYALLSMAGGLTLPLIMLHDVKPMQAIKMSFSGSLHNLLPILCAVIVLCLVGLGLGFTFMMLFGSFTAFSQFSQFSQLNIWAMIGLGLAIFLFALILPIFNAGLVYASYRNIWTNLPMK